MRPLFCFLLASALSAAWASIELWVIYHRGCPRCDAFLDEVVPTYPEARYLPAGAPSLRLLDTSLEAHREMVLALRPPVYSTPTFVYVDVKGDALTVLDRWAGYTQKHKFYEKLKEVVDAAS